MADEDPFGEFLQQEPAPTSYTEAPEPAPEVDAGTQLRLLVESSVRQEQFLGKMCSVLMALDEKIDRLESSQERLARSMAQGGSGGGGGGGGPVPPPQNYHGGGGAPLPGRDRNASFTETPEDKRRKAEEQRLETERRTAQERIDLERRAQEMERRAQEEERLRKEREDQQRLELERRKEEERVKKEELSKKTNNLLGGLITDTGGGGLFGASSSGGAFGGAGAGAFGGAGAGAFGAAGAGAFGSAQPGTMQQPGMMGPDAQLLCMELAKRMEDLYPVLQQAGGQRVTTGAANAALQQSFVAYTYSFSSNPQQLQQANSGQFNPAVHVDYAKWAQAVQNNPAPQSCYPEPLVGLPALEQRLHSQQSAVEQCTNELEDLKTGFSNLKHSLQAQSLQKLEECRRRHQKLSRQLLQVTSAIETYAVRTGAARRSPHLEASLEERLERLQEAIQAPGSARARQEELWVVLRGLLQRGPPSGGAATLSEADAEKTLRVTAAQGELLELLQEELAGRQRDLTQFENTMARFCSAPPPTAQLL